MIEKKYLDEYAYMKDMAYLNVCGVALQPQRTLDVCRDFQQEFVDARGVLAFGPYGQRRYKVKEAIGRMINASPDEIQFCTNTTEGNCLLMNAYPLKAGDSVIISHFDFPAVFYGWYKLRDSKGITVKNVGDHNGCIEADDIIARMDDTTKIVAISWVQYMSGFARDLEKIGNACHERGIIFMVDGIQGLGRNPIDVKKCHIDLFACASFKGMLGLLGGAFYYVDENLIPKLTPLYHCEENIDSVEDRIPVLEDVTEEDIPYRNGIDRLEGGAMSSYSVIAMGTSVNLLLEIGIDNIKEHVLELEKHYRRLINEAGLPVEWLGSEDSERWSGNICLYFDLEKSPLLAEKCKEKDIHVTIKSVRGKGFLRIAPHYYNTMEHMERLVNVLKEVLV